MPYRLNAVLLRLALCLPLLLMARIAGVYNRLCGVAPEYAAMFGSSRSCVVLMRNVNPPNHASMSAAGSGSNSGSRVERNHRIVRWMPSARSTVTFHPSSFSALVASRAMACNSPVRAAV
ncbi:MAG: hypothetical protein QOH91_1632 [Mycobacterium sp.]|nr:hypothetical protein [Mycobacterium sp.]